MNITGTTTSGIVGNIWLMYFPFFMFHILTLISVGVCYYFNKYFKFNVYHLSNCLLMVAMVDELYYSFFNIISAYEFYYTMLETLIISFNYKQLIRVSFSVEQIQDALAWFMDVLLILLENTAIDGYRLACSLLSNKLIHALNGNIFPEYIYSRMVIADNNRTQNHYRCLSLEPNSASVYIHVSARFLGTGLITLPVATGDFNVHHGSDVCHYFNTRNPHVVILRHKNVVRVLGRSFFEISVKDRYLSAVDGSCQKHVLGALYNWCLSSRQRNRAMHALNGNRSGKTICMQHVMYLSDPLQNAPCRFGDKCKHSHKPSKTININGKKVSTSDIEQKVANRSTDIFEGCVDDPNVASSSKDQSVAKKPNDTSHLSPLPATPPISNDSQKSQPASSAAAEKPKEMQPDPPAAAKDNKKHHQPKHFKKDYEKEKEQAKQPPLKHDPAAMKATLTVPEKKEKEPDPIPTDEKPVVRHKHEGSRNIGNMDTRQITTIFEDFVVPTLLIQDFDNLVKKQTHTVCRLTLVGSTRMVSLPVTLVAELQSFWVGKKPSADEFRLCSLYCTRLLRDLDHDARDIALANLFAPLIAFEMIKEDLMAVSKMQARAVEEYNFDYDYEEEMHKMEMNKVEPVSMWPVTIAVSFVIGSMCVFNAWLLCISLVIVVRSYKKGSDWLNQPGYNRMFLVVISVCLCIKTTVFMLVLVPVLSLLIQGIRILIRYASF